MVAVLGIMLVIFLFAIDATIVASAMPTVVSRLGDLELYSWVFSIYMLTSALATPLFGKLSDLYSRRFLMLLGIAVFLAGSALCGAATSMFQLVLFRAIQGIGGGAIYALAFIIVGVVFPAEKRGQMQGRISSVWGIAAILGPVGGGIIAEYWSWPWIFWINLPLGAGAAVLIFRGFHEERTQARQRPLDLAGAIVLSLALFLLFQSLFISADRIELMSPDLVAMVVACGALFLLFTWIETRAEEPIVPMELFRIGAFTAPTLLSLLAAMGIFGVIGYVPLYVQGALGRTAAVAGLSLLPVSIGWTAGSLFAGRVMNGWGHRNVCAAGMSSMLLGYVLLLTAQTASYFTPVIVSASAIGLGMGMVNVTALVAAQASVPFHHLGVATSTLMLFRTLGGALVLSIMGSVLLRAMNASLAALAEGATASLPEAVVEKLMNPQSLLEPSTRALIPSRLLPALTDALINALWWAFVVGLAAVIVGLALCYFIRTRSSEEKNT